MPTQNEQRQPMSPKYKSVLARIDPHGPYGPGNLLVRAPRSRRERITGLVDLSPLEPLIIPLTDEQQEHRASLTSQQEMMYFDVLVRMQWRAQNYPLTPSEDNKGFAA